ncbi:vacuolar protein-sorting-associated protein 36-like [Halichondria panicea]|uniref:vacuolar protein-sorting-associated protein 36-like n=1 Tax=Halichondria panicea TaxID=6063 RepID=UPI00312B423C
MDRCYWYEREHGELAPGERVLFQQGGIRLYDGEERTTFESGNLQLTTHRLIWDDEDQEGRVIAFDLALVTAAEHIAPTFTKSAKILLKLAKAPATKPQGPSVIEKAAYIRLSFRKGGQNECLTLLKEALASRQWERIAVAPAKGAQLKMRSGIMGIERGIERKQKETNKEVNEAFKDLDALIDKAKNMVGLVNKFAAKIEEKKGSLSEDETIQFKAYLLSVGIANPVTKETHGSGSAYHKELSKELATFLDNPLQECGGMMSLSDVYCRFNRARGMELVSPEDVVNACNQFKSLSLPLRMRRFDSGVLVVQSLSHSEEVIIKTTAELIKESGSLTAEELSKHSGVSIMLANERLLGTEKVGLVCRDDSVEGLRFYPNRFLEMDT